MNRSTGKTQAIEKIIGVIVLFVALGAAVCAGYFYLESRSARNWPAVEGIITKSDTRVQRSPGSGSTPTTIADVWYTYNVDGIEYHNDTISHAQYGASSASHAVKEARRYPVGSKVRVYYNPDSPRDSVLEHKIPWIFISIFAGLGAILIFIGIMMLSGGFSSSPSASAKWHAKRASVHGSKTRTTAGFGLIIAVILSSAFIALLSFKFFSTEDIESREGSGQATDNVHGGNNPQLVFTYSKADASPPCSENLKAQVAERQKIHLNDDFHSLYVTATLCIDEQEMKAAGGTHRTWPIIARHIAAYDISAFDTDSAVSGPDEENAPENFESRLKGIEQGCLERLHENGIFFVKAIKFNFLQVFRTD